MDLRLTEQDAAFRRRVREWLREHAPRAPLRTLEEQRAWHRQLYEAGFVGMGWPVAYGGWDARPIEQAIVAEELVRANVHGPINYMGLSTAGPTIMHHGTEQQKRRFLRPILTADEIWCQLFSEPNAGSDLASLQCRAEREGDVFVVNGQKTWTSSALEADWGLLLARTDPDAPKHRGISCFVVDMRSPGIEVRPLTQITGSREFAEVFFDNVRVPIGNLVGELNQGWQVAQTPLTYERGADAVTIVTRLQGQLERLLDVAARLRRDGRPLLDDPVTRQRLGAAVAEIEALRYVSLRVLSALEKGEHPGPQASVFKLTWSEADRRLQELFLEVLGPYGQQVEGMPEWAGLDVHAESGTRAGWPYLMLWAKAGTIYAGSSQIQKNIIGERVLGLPKEARADRLAAARQV